jgi:transcription elongation factor SPT5
MGTPSPTGYSPAGAPQSPYNPQTPGASLDSHGGADWCTTDIEVKIRSHDLEADFIGQTGIIRTVNNGICSVFLPDEDRVVTVVSENLEPVMPKSGDHFKMIFGDDRETQGVLISAEGKEAMVLMNGKHALLPLNHLCKMKSD